MKVRATKLGFYNNRKQREGTVFFLKERKLRGKKLSAEDQFSELWMEKVDGAEAPKKAPAKKAKATPSEQVDQNQPVI